MWSETKSQIFAHTPRKTIMGLKTGKSWDMFGGVNVGKLLSVVILIVIGLLLTPLVADSVADAQDNANISASASTLLGMITIFYVLGLVLAGVLWVVAETRGMGG